MTENNISSASDTITMYCTQPDLVWDIVDKDGVNYVKQAYITKKYQDTAWIFEVLILSASGSENQEKLAASFYGSTSGRDLLARRCLVSEKRLGSQGRIMLYYKQELYLQIVQQRWMCSAACYFFIWR